MNCHYVTERDDTPFWRHVASIASIRNPWSGSELRDHMPGRADFPDYLGGFPHTETTLYYPVLDGLGHLSREVAQREMAANPVLRKRASEISDGMHAEFDRVAGLAISHRELLDELSRRISAVDHALAFLAGTATLLAVPGPTNTLLAASGAAVGARRSLILVPIEIAGYLVAIGCLMTVVAPLANSTPLLPIVAKLVASLWLAITAVTLWRNGRNHAVSVAPVSPAQLFVTTLLNPKALVFAFVIFPVGGVATFAESAAVFAALVGAIGTGSDFPRRRPVPVSSGPATPRLIARIASIALCVFAALIASSAVAALAMPTG